MVTFLDRVGSAQPFVLSAGEKKSSIQTFYIILDQKPIPCVAQSAVATFNELFKVCLRYPMRGPLLSFYTFIQTTVYGIDLATTKGSGKGINKI